MNEHEERKRPCPRERARVSEQYIELQHLERTASERIRQGVEAAEARVTNAEAARDAAIAASAAAESVAKVARETQAGLCVHVSSIHTYACFARLQRSRH